MKTKSELNKEAFDDLLKWLNADRDRAGEKYEEIRRKLTKFYLRRGCPLAIAEELTDETVNRVSRKVHEIAATYVGEPAIYCYGFAQNVYYEFIKQKQDARPLPPTDSPEEKERNYQCLDSCMQLLDSDSRVLILEYYREDRKAKIDYRKALADQRGLTLNNLRMRILRIKTGLRLCVVECIRHGEN